MLIDHRTFTVKRGMMDEALAVLKAELARIREAYDVTGVTRTYVSYVGRFDMLVHESEWDNLSDWEAFWATWPISPEGMEFLEKWVRLTESSGGVELWTLVDMS